MLKSFQSKAAVVGTGLAALGSQAMAAVPSGVKEGIEGAATDAVTVGGYVIVAVAAIFAIFLILRVLK